MMSKPLQERRELARQLRSMSIDAASNKPEDIMDVNAQAVATAMEAAGVARMIHGHTHRPARHETDDRGTRCARRLDSAAGMATQRARNDAHAGVVCYRPIAL